MPLKELVDGAHHNIEGFHLRGVMPAVRKHDLLDGDTANSVKEGGREVQWCPGICCWLSKQERTDRKILRLRSPTTRPLWHHQCPRHDGRVLGSAVVTHAQVGPSSSVDRALASGARSRRFESYLGHFCANPSPQLAQSHQLCKKWAGFLYLVKRAPRRYLALVHKHHRVRVAHRGQPVRHNDDGQPPG